jgi:F-type H+-transporting ATPase subunit b
MHIDWFTFGAQAVNFLVLVWLLKRFLYRPVLKAIEAREQRIAAQLRDAEASRQAGEAEQARLKAEREAFAAERDALMARAVEEVKLERARLLDAARSDADAFRARLRETLAGERRQLADMLARRTRHEVLAIARQALSELAGVELEARIVEVFTQQLDSLAPETLALLAPAPHEREPVAWVRSAFELPAAQRAALEQAVRRTLGGRLTVRFEAADGLLGGVELSSGGHKVAWSIDQHLASLEQGLDEVVAGAHRPPEQGSAP